MGLETHLEETGLKLTDTARAIRMVIGVPDRCCKKGAIKSCHSGNLLRLKNSNRNGLYKMAREKADVAAVRSDHPLTGGEDGYPDPQHRAETQALRPWT